MSTENHAIVQPTTVFNSQNPQSTLLTVNMSGITKLTHQNYLMWSRQVLALLEGHELHGFLHQSNDVPTATITVDGKTTPNPEFAPWRRQDRLLYSALIGAISLPVQTVVSSATTTAEIWKLLLTAYGNPTRGHVRQLKLQIKACTKGTQTIAEYLRTIKSKADELALLGKAMDPEDLNEHIMAGLGEEYKPEVDAINGRDSTISYTKLYERLLNREAMLLGSQTTLPTPVVANAVDSRYRPDWKSNNNQSYRGNQAPNNHRNNFNSNHNNYRGSYNSNQSRGGSKQYLGKCQACGTVGHSAKYCPDFRIVRGSQSSQSWQQPQPPHAQPWNQPRANPALLSDASTWLVDSGASHHMTSDLANLSLHSPYQGPDDVILGDGSGERFGNGGTSFGRQA